MGTVTPTPSASGGTLAAGTYFFRVVAADARGDLGLASAEVSAVTTGSTGSVALAWTGIATAIGYRVYFSTTSGSYSTYFATSSNGITFTTTTGGLAGAIPTSNGGYAVRLDPVNQSILSSLTITSSSNPGLSVGTSSLGGNFRLGDATLTKQPSNFFSFNNDGVQGINNLMIGQNSPTVARPLLVKNNLGNVSRVVSTILGMTGQTGDLTQWRDPTDTTTLASVSASGKFQATAATTSTSSINIPSGTAPTTPNDGDIWFDGTALKVRIAGVTKSVTVS